MVGVYCATAPGVFHVVVMAATAYLLLFLCATASAKLPLASYITPCAKSDPDFKACVQKSANETIPHILDGDKKYKAPVYVPLKIDLLEVKQESLGIAISLKDVNIWGFREMQLGDIDIDLNDKHMKYQLFLPHVEMIMKYNVSGKFLVLPVVGNGDGNITFLNLHMEIAFDYSLEERDGDEYLIPGVNKLDINTTRMYVHLDNLFNGDKLLGESTNVALNENWEELLKSVGPIVAEAIGQVSRSLFTNFFLLVPYNTAFPD